MPQPVTSVTGFAMTVFLGSAVLVQRADRGVRPYTGEGVRCAVGRADVGSELSAAGGRGSEVSEWPRSKF